MNNQNLANVNRIARNILVRYNLVMLVVFVGCFLMFTTLSIASIVNQQGDNTANSESTGFDQLTINKLSRYETSASNVNYKTLPQSRTNPFFE